MGFLDWFRREKRITDYTADELRREEGRLQIRENQAMARLEKSERQREEIFRQGLGLRSPVRRRILARKYEQKEGEIRLIERELMRLMKEAMTVSAIRHRLQKRTQGDTSILRKITAGDIDRLGTLAEDDSVQEDLYREKLEEVLGIVADDEGDPLEKMTGEGKAILEVWERMDLGEFESVEDGYREARRRSGEIRETDRE